MFLSGYEPEHQRLARVNHLIEGFETPYGMELLASVHWLAVHETPAARTQEDAVAGVQAWNERKRQMFRPDHIHVAWDRLTAGGWIRET